MRLTPLYPVLLLLFSFNTFAQGDGVKFGVAAGKSDADQTDMAQKVHLSYDYWWDGGFELAFKRFTSPELNDFDLASAGIYYQKATNDELIFSLQLGAASALTDTVLFDKGDFAATIAFGVHWRVTNYLSLDLIAESMSALGDLDKSSTVYLGVTVWPFADDNPPLVFKNMKPRKRTKDSIEPDWQEAVVLHEQQPQKTEPKVVHTEIVKQQPEQMTFEQPKSGFYYLQIGTFGNDINATRAAQTASYSGFDIYTETPTNTELTRVMVGAFNNENSAKKAQTLIWRMFDDKPLIVKR